MRLPYYKRVSKEVYSKFFDDPVGFRVDYVGKIKRFFYSMEGVSQH